MQAGSPHVKPGHKRAQRSWLIAALAVLIVAMLSAIAWAALADRAFPARPTKVIVERGTTLRQVADQLQSSGVVRSRLLLSWYVRATRALTTVEAGEYDFDAHQTMPEIARRLAAGGRPVAVWLTVPEGFTARQIAHRLATYGLVDAGEFLRVARETSLILGGIRTPGLEGYLFPDTYLIPRETTAGAVASQMTAQFTKELPKNYIATARRLRYSVPQIITLASLIEREAKVETERRLIAGVLYNRLRRSMPLEVDATIEYALPQHKTELTYQDLKIDSPYNTYTHFGLPPTPIANPGRSSILAAFDPQSTDFLYYVYMGKGRHQFSRTLSEQRAAEEKYLK